MFLILLTFGPLKERKFAALSKARERAHFRRMRLPL
jgi:hypothetical protein